MDAAMYGSFFTAATYENLIDFEVFSVSEDAVWILGVKYSFVHEREKLELDVRSRLLFTYRKGFKPIGEASDGRSDFVVASDSGYTSDLGWGCMLRCGQMLMAQALINRHLTRHWRWKCGKYDPKYFEVLRLFQDKQDCCYSIHHIASMGITEGKSIGEWFGPNTVMQVFRMGISEGKSIGEWFGPNTVMQVFRKLAGYDQWSGMVVHVAMDSTVIVDDIRSQCLVEDSSNEIFLEASDVPSIILSAFQSAQRQHQHFPGSSASVHSRNGSHHNVTASKSTSDGCEPQSSTADNATERDSEQCPKRHSPSPHTLVETRQRWRPLLLVIPLRLGLSEINPVYFSAVKMCLTFRQSVGIIGGRPNHAHWFIGFAGDKLYFLDPHTQQSVVDLSATVDDMSYHCRQPSSIDISQLDPSVAMGFYCGSEDEFNGLCKKIRQHFMTSDVQTPIFEVQEHKLPVHITSLSSQPGGSIRSSRQPLDIESEYEIL